jgi:predicted dehydrogenase
MDKINIGVIGCGRIGQVHLKAFSRVHDVTIAGVCDINPAVAFPSAGLYRCQPYTDYSAMLDIEGLEAVVIAVPPNMHAEIACAAMGRGIHVLCEKPFAIGLAAAKVMCSAAQDSSVVLMMASKYRFVDDVVKAKEFVRSGILGRVYSYRNAFMSIVDMSGRWNSNREVAGGGVLIDNGAHAVDIAKFLLGPLTRVKATLEHASRLFAVEDTAHLSFEGPHGVAGTIDLSWTLENGSEPYIVLTGTAGEMEIGWNGSRFRLSGHEAWETFGAGYNKEAAFQGQSQHFIDCLRGVSAPSISLEDCIDSVRVIETAYVSARDDQWLDLV